MISSEFGFIFVHIPKTGGNSIQDALRGFCDDDLVILNPLQDGIERFEVRNKNHSSLHKHSPLNDYYKEIGGNILNYKLFTTLRNPFDKLVSYYFSPHRGSVTWNEKAFERLVKSIPPMQSYIFIHGPPYDKPTIPLEKIRFLRFEHINEDFSNLCAELSLPNIDLPHRNKSKRKPYQDCFSKDLRNWVYEAHKLEIKLGNYTF